MDLTRRRKRTKQVETGSLAELYPHNLQMYYIPPIHEITLMELEELAQERVKVLRILELVNLRGLSKYSEAWRSALAEELNKQGLKQFYKMATSPTCKQTEAELAYRKRDHISHFILRLAYCKSEELRRWFLARELELFRLRFLSLNSEPVQNFLKLNNLKYFPISSEEKEALKGGLHDSTYGIAHYTNIDFYRVKFTEVLELIRSRRVFLKGGYAYVPSSELVLILSSVFRSHLAQALQLTFKHLPHIGEEDRVLPLLKNIHTTHFGNDFTGTKSGIVRLEDLDKFARSSFPLCMRFIHETVRTTHHAKHFSRLQYGLFMKGIGLSLEDTLRFWRDEFCRTMDLDKFEKSYSYVFRHSYGQEGARKNYTPYGCGKIIGCSVGPGETHGCPFKHADSKVLTNKLQHYEVHAQFVKEIAEIAKNGHYQIACGKYFEAVHGVRCEKGISHPNQYFEDSLEALGLKTKNEPPPKQSNRQNFVRNQYVGKKNAPVEAKAAEDLWGDDFDFNGIDVDMGQ